MTTTTRFFALLTILLTISACTNKPDPDIASERIAVKPIVNVAGFDSTAVEPDFQVMLDSFQDFGSFYTRTIYGNYSELVAFHQQQIQEYFQSDAYEKRKMSVHCSMFSYFGNPDSMLYGRNFDNVETELLVGFYFPTGKHASIGFTPLTEFGFNQARPFDPANLEHRQTLLQCPIATIEGINEKGVVVSLASMTPQPVYQDATKSSKFLIHLIREILDEADDVAEAVEIADRYNVFDNGPQLISHHIFIAGSEGTSVILE